MLMSVAVLLAAPATPAASAMLRDDCCVETPCHDQGDAALCPEACVLACQVVVAPELMMEQSVEVVSAPADEALSLSPPGRELAPELPPPR